MTIYQSSEQIYQSSFVELFYKTHSNTIIVKWLPDNINMSPECFTNELYAIFETIQTIKADRILFNSLVFNHFISPSNLIAIKQFAEAFPIKDCVVINSKYAMGRMVVNSLASSLSSIKINIIMFSSEKEGENWFLESCVLVS